MKWLNVTYPRFLQNEISRMLWEVIFCKIGFHLFDEVSSARGHYLFCDACCMEIFIEEREEDAT